MDLTIGVDSIVNSFFEEHEGEAGAKDRRRSQPFFYGMPEILSPVALAVHLQGRSLPEAVWSGIRSIKV